MKSALFALPFIALLTAAIGTSIASSFQIGWLKWGAWGIAAAVIGLWAVLDIEGFKKVFARKGAKYGASSGLTVVLGLLVIIAVGVLSNRTRFNKSFDATKSKANTLSEQTVKILQGLSEKSQSIEVIAFFQDEEQKQKFADTIANYSRVADVLKIRYINPQVDPVEARSLNITSANTVIFKTEKQEARVTQVSEEKITNALVKVLKDRAKTVYFTKGHGEPKLKEKEAAGYDIVTQELENNKYEVKDISLLESTTVPDDADMVAVLGAKYDFAKSEVEQLDAYVKRGGALLLAFDAVTALPNLQAFSEQLGVKIRNDILIMRPDDPRARLIGQDMAIVEKFDESHPLSKDFGGSRRVALLVPGARSLEEVSENASKLKVTLIGKTSNAMIRVKDVSTQSDLKNINQSRIEEGEFAVFAVASGKVEGAASAEKKSEDTKEKESRVVVAGSSQFASNTGAQRPANRDMFMNAVSYLVQDEDFISIRPRDESKGTLDVSSAASQLQLLLISWIYPFLFLGGGILFWLNRRRA